MIFFSELFGKNSSLCFFSPYLDLCRDGTTTISSIVRSVIWFMVPSRLFALLLFRRKLPKCRRRLPGVGVRSSELSQLEALSFWVTGELMKREKESFDTWANWTLSLNRQLSLSEWGNSRFPWRFFLFPFFCEKAKVRDISSPKQDASYSNVVTSRVTLAFIPLIAKVVFESTIFPFLEPEPVLDPPPQCSGFFDA